MSATKLTIHTPATGVAETLGDIPDAHHDFDGDGFDWASHACLGNPIELINAKPALADAIKANGLSFFMSVDICD